MKKQNQMGFTHHLALIVVGVLVVSAVGFAGFRVYKSKNDVNAKAAGYTKVPFGNNSSGYFCRTYIDSLRKYRIKTYVHFGTTTNWSYSVRYTSNAGVATSANFYAAGSAGTNSAAKYAYINGLGTINGYSITTYC